MRIDLNQTQRRVLKLMQEREIGGVSVNLSASSRIALDSALPHNQKVWMWTAADIHENAFAADLMLRILENGAVWVPQTERFYWPVRKPKL
jgi:hypothetical protein